MRNDSFDLPSVLRRVRKNFFVLLGGTGIATLLNFATVAINARAIGPDGVGLNGMFFAAAMLIIGLFSFGTQQPLIRLGTQAISEGRDQHLGVIAGCAFTLDAMVAGLAGIVSLVLVVSASKQVEVLSSHSGAALYYTIVVFFSGVGASNGVLRLLNRFGYISLIQVLTALAILTSAAIFYFTAAPVDWYLYTNATILAVSTQLQVLLAIVLLHQNGTPVRVRPRLFTGSMLREFFSYAWTTNGAGTLNTIRANLDVVLVGAFFGPAASGIYGVARQLTGALNKIAGTVSSVVFPEISALGARRDLEAARHLLSKLAVWGFIVGSLGVAAAISIGDEVLRMAFGDNFSPAFIPLVLLVAAATFSISAASFGGFVQVFISPLAVLRIYFFAFILFAFASLPLILKFGSIGAASAQLIFTVVVWISSWRTVSEHLATKNG